MVSRRGCLRALGGAAAITAVASAGVLGWSAWDIRCPAGTASFDRRPYGRTSPAREVLLPLQIHPLPITKLALLEFVAGVDPI